MLTTRIGAGLLGGLLVSACQGDDASTGSESTSLGDESLNPSGVGDGFGAVQVGADARPGPSVLGKAGGWTITYERLLVALGEVEGPSRSGVADLALPGRFVVDLVDTSVVGLQPDMPIHEGLYGPLAFIVAPPSALSRAVESVTAAELDALRQEGVSIVIEGAIADPADPKQITFRWRLPARVRFSGCGNVDVWASANAEINLGLAVDAWFRTGFMADAAAAPRAAQWIADADLDRDGETTLDELKQLPADVLFTKDRGYDLTGAPIPIATAYDFLLAQAMMMGAHDDACERVTPLDPG